MRSSINNELGYTELIIEENIMYHEDYQIRMLRECQLEGLMRMVGYGEDDRSQYIYDITGMQSIRQVYEREPVSEGVVKDICRYLLDVMERVKEHMLDVNKIMLEPEYIFKGEKGYTFCYYPLNQSGSNDSFHSFTEYLVKAVDYDDVNAVRLVCGLHKCTMDQQYDLAEVLERYSELEFEIQVPRLDIKGQDMGDIWSQEVEDDLCGLDNKVQESMEGKSTTEYNIPWERQMAGVLRETPFAKWLGEHKKPATKNDRKVKIKNIGKEKWGDWDALINEELPNR